MNKVVGLIIAWGISAVSWAMGETLLHQLLESPDATTKTFELWLFQAMKYGGQYTFIGFFGALIVATLCARGR